MINLKLLVWVTSDCNLTCPLCNQFHSMGINLGYHMPLNEVKNLVESCKRRNIHFSVIELIGGEPTLWVNLKEGIKILNEITDDIFFVTNGQNPELVISLGLKHWIVSTSQATKAQWERFKGHTDKIICNVHQHKIVPVNAIPNSIPAVCVVAVDPFNPIQRENGIGYLRGKMYYCNLAFALSDRVPLTDDMWCDLEDDFVTKFSNKTFDKEICKYCLCNGKVWSQI